MAADLCQVRKKGQVEANQGRAEGWRGETVTRPRKVPGGGFVDTFAEGSLD